MSKIYVKFKKPETLREFIKLFFSNEYQNLLTGPETFADKDCTLQQCPEHKLRSFDDLFFCCKTYFPEVTPKDVMHEILTIQLRLKSKDLVYPQLNCCSTMNRIRVLYYKTEYSTNPFETNQYSSKYSWEELLGMLGITNQKQLVEYVKTNRKDD